MDTQTLSPVVRRAGEGPQRWFFGGGIWTWKAASEDTADSLLVVDVQMDGGKRTPLHTHPIAESLWLLEGRLRYRIGSKDFELAAGDFVMVPAEVPHAFLVLSEAARILVIQAGSDCEAFYLGASEPLEGSARATDFRQLAESAERNGGITILAPPPF